MWNDKYAAIPQGRTSVQCSDDTQSSTYKRCVAILHCYRALGGGGRILRNYNHSIKAFFYFATIIQRPPLVPSRLRIPCFCNAAKASLFTLTRTPPRTCSKIGICKFFSQFNFFPNSSLPSLSPQNPQNRGQ